MVPKECGELNFEFCPPRQHSKVAGSRGSGAFLAKDVFSQKSGDNNRRGPVRKTKLFLLLMLCITSLCSGVL